MSSPAPLRPHPDRLLPTDPGRGPDIGTDIPRATEYTRALRPLLERLVGEHRLDEDEAVETAVALVDENPRTTFRL